MCSLVRCPLCRAGIRAPVCGRGAGGFWPLRASRRAARRFPKSSDLRALVLRAWQSPTINTIIPSLPAAVYTFRLPLGFSSRLSRYSRYFLESAATTCDSVWDMDSDIGSPDDIEALKAALVAEKVRA